MSKPGAALAHADGDARTRVRWSSRRPFRRFAAILTSLALGAGLAVVGVAAPASAHHNTISATATCDVATGTFDITWTVENSEKRVETITKSSNEALVPVGTAFGKREVKTFTQNDVADGTYKLDLSAKWDNGATQSNSGRITVDSENCGQPVKKIEFCHATGSSKNPYVRIETSVRAFFKAGHIDHQDNGDIYPAFSYLDNKGKLINVPAQGDPSLLAYKDCVKPSTPIAVPAEPTKADECGVDNDHIVKPADITGVKWTIGEVVDGKATATATTLPGYVFANGKTEQSWKFTFTDVPCTVEVPVPAEPAKVDECGVKNDHIVQPEKTTGVAWTIGDVVDGKATATATTLPGYVFANGKHVRSWVLDFTDEPCIIELEVPTASFSDPCGVDNYDLDYDDKLVGVEWTKSIVDGKLTLTAKPAKGYAFKGGQKVVEFGPWTLDQKPCDIVVEVPTEASFSDDCGVDNYELEYNDKLVGVVWTKSIVDGKLTLTATPAEGYTFKGDEQVKVFGPWTLNQKPCDVVVKVPTAATFVDTCGVDNYDLDYEENLLGVEWAKSIADGKLTLTATPAKGYVFEGDVTSKVFGPWVLNDKPCVEPTLTGSFATGTCVADSPWITYDVELTDPDKQSTSNTASLVLTDGTNTQTIVLGDLKDGSLTGKVLWPGASVDEDGKANGWPGWALVGDKWIEVDDNFAWTRGDITAKLAVNPEVPVTISYPKATPECATGPKVTPPGGGEGSTPSEPNGAGLASTGFAGTSIAIVAGIIVLAGVAFLVVARIRRKRA
ncbi:hypothetical protein BJY17_000177 [Agromyces hippuratus]|uniref:Uncharacterized protein n=1 Tax=Agromyces hippuratus TaxID=286438 RepID=A0A852WSY3_9MICO|nr:hypothetical protein [Agromyces hippuratus]NYG19430.1 hypothetical protein [Agromyces hippuratus]